MKKIRCLFLFGHQLYLLQYVYIYMCIHILSGCLQTSVIYFMMLIVYSAMLLIIVPGTVSEGLNGWFSGLDR